LTVSYTARGSLYSLFSRMIFVKRRKKIPPLVTGIGDGYTAVARAKCNAEQDAWNAHNLLMADIYGTRASLRWYHIWQRLALALEAWISQKRLLKHLLSADIDTILASHGYVLDEVQNTTEVWKQPDELSNNPL